MENPAAQTLEVPAIGVTVQPDTKEALPVPVPSYAIDPTTGLALDVIKTGECPEHTLGDTALQPTDFAAEAATANKNGVGE